MRCRTVLAMGMALSILGFISGGCGGGRGKMPELGKVTGKVTYNGRPVSKGTVSFVPIPGMGGETGQSALGEIGPDGSFELTTFDTGDGAIIGQHKAIVVVPSEGEKVASDFIPSQNKADMKTTPKPLVPEKYMDAEKTPLRYTVRPGTNSFTLELKD